jgi:hypothetical protein
MNLLELQVLAVVSRIPNGNDAPSPEFAFEPVASAPNDPVAVSGPDSAPPAAEARGVKQPV